MALFQDRQEAGQKLAGALDKYRGEEGAVVYALPRGGVPLGAEIARELDAPLDLIITRKIGHRLNPEYAICAVAEQGEPICNESELASADKQWFQDALKQERLEAKRRREVYLQGRKSVPATGKTAIIVDDGIATGLTMRAAIAEARHQNPKQVVVAVPVVPPDTAEVLKREADELAALEIPAVYLGAVGAYYDKFDQTEDSEVINLLRKYNET